ncbi:aryl-sulfate sulfotransferase [Escherichia coli]|uniref:aryl-sulfate sulfotransferase n=1 Tax=Escherichia coli TaxID=562 RepID=UPI0032E89FB4
MQVVCVNVDLAHRTTGKTGTRYTVRRRAVGEVNWAHVNSIAYDAKDDSIILSSRHRVL